MKDFRYLNYSTEYSCAGIYRKSQVNISACFGAVFRALEHEKVCSEEYVIILHKGITYCSTMQRSNSCLCTRIEIKNHLRQVRELFPFKFLVIDKGDIFELHLKLEDLPSMVHKYILTWVRYLYEYPYNVILRDAWKLKKLTPALRFESISNLFNIISVCYPHGVGGVHSVSGGTPVYLLSKKSLKANILKRHYLNEIYPDCDEVREGPIAQIPKDIHKYSIYDLEYWENEECLNCRIPKYLELYESIRSRGRL